VVRPFHVTVLCHDCPFKREGGIRLMSGRITEITDGLLDHQGATFACHKTTGAMGNRVRKERRDLHCLGALIFSEKHEIATQMTRIAERLGMYDAAKVMQSKYVGQVFDSVDEMMETALDGSNGRRQKTNAPRRRR